jgi:U4/U6 small nuclear ribonucleoprotein PRP4
MLTRVWDLRSGKTVQVYRGHSKPVLGNTIIGNIIIYILGLDWARDGYRLMSNSEDNSCRIYDIRKKRQSYVIPAHTNNVVTAKFHHNDDLIFTGSCDNTIKFWSPLDYSPIKSILGNEGKILSVDVSNDFKYIITGNYDRTWKLFMKTDFSASTSAMDVDPAPSVANGTHQ